MIYHVTITSMLTHTQSHSHNQNHVKRLFFFPVGYPITFSHHHRCSPYPPPSSPTHQTSTLPIHTSKKNAGSELFFLFLLLYIYIYISLINFAVHIPAPLGSSTGFLSERRKEKTVCWGLYIYTERERERSMCLNKTAPPLPSLCKGEVSLEKNRESRFVPIKNRN